MQKGEGFRERLFHLFPLPGDSFGELVRAVSFREVSSGRVLLREGEMAVTLFIVMKGCLREYFIKEDGKEITFQFFVEGEIVASFESAMTAVPSKLYIETIEDSIIGFLPMETLRRIVRNPGTRNGFTEFLMKRLVYYMKRCSSYVLDNPEKRYLKLVEENPDLIARLPKQYIASYLGITPVSLSRIRNRVKKRTGTN